MKKAIRASAYALVNSLIWTLSSVPLVSGLEGFHSRSYFALSFLPLRNACTNSNVAECSFTVKANAYVFYVCEKGPLVSLLLHLLSVYTSGGSRGVPWVPRNPHFCRFAHMRRRPRAHPRAQSKTFWTAEPPLSKSQIRHCIPTQRGCGKTCHRN